MKIGNIDITRAYFGSLELTSSNAYVGEFKVIEGEEPAWDGLTFTALQDNSTIGMSHFGTNKSTTTPNLEYSRDGESWTPWFFETLTVNKGQKIYFRGNNPNGIGRSTSNYSVFAGTGQFSLEGNIMSILYANDYNERFDVSQFCFCRLFYNNKSIYDAENLILPATTLATYCYSEMFYNCTNLVNAPSLPATTLIDRCYNSMFLKCISLVNAPELPSTTLATYCYNAMFNGCSSLVNAPSLPATTLDYGCYAYMFNGCSSLVNAPSLPATTLATYCYSSMFSGCTSLVNAPILPATTLASSCYSYMFNGCTSLVNAPILPATTLASSCYLYMFNGCTSLVNAPELPATTLASSCYSNMFKGCKKLNYVKHHITDWSLFSASGWLSGVASSGTVECPADSTIPSDSTSGIPVGWTRVDF